MYKTDRTEEVYQYIWDYVTEHEALPNHTQIAEALAMSKDEVSWWVQALRKARRIEPRVLLPTAYGDWWRVYVRKEWSYEAMRRS